MSFFRRLSRRSSARRRPAPQGKEGARLYAIGDIHGRLDLLDTLLGKIDEDRAARGPRKTYVVFLGDLIDRGPESAGVVERLRIYGPEGVAPIFLAGNHEEIFTRILDGEADILADWLKFGGSECVESYGVDPAALRKMEPEAAVALLREKVPPAHVRFLEGFADTFRFGDYLFVHAGIRPGVELHEQDQWDLRWIREPFLSFEDEHGLMVVHGHTIVAEVDERPNRIALDTGAYRSGILTALAVEDGERWYLSTSGSSAAEPAAGEAGP